MSIDYRPLLRRCLEHEGVNMEPDIQPPITTERPESAFPWQRYAQWEDFDFGMTLRDYFAAKALQGMLAGGGDYEKSDGATEAYKWADAMLAARG